MSACCRPRPSGTRWPARPRSSSSSGRRSSYGSPWAARCCRGREGAGMSGRRKRILFICGSLNQTTQMHQVARELLEHEHAFTPYYCEGALEWCRRAGVLEFTIIGDKLRERRARDLEAGGLPLDPARGGGEYELVGTCSHLLAHRQARAVA